MDLNSSQTPQEDLWSIKNIERTSILLGLILFVAVLFFKPTGGLISGAVSGVLVGWLNFRLLGRFVSKLVAKAETGAGKSSAAIFIKMILLFAVVGLLILYIKVDAIGFVLGFSCNVIAIVLEGIKNIF